MRACLAVLVLTVMVRGQPRPVSAQAPEVRGALDSVFVALGSIDSTGTVAPVQARCSVMAGRAGSLCDAFVRLRVAELDPSSANALRADQAFRTVHFSEDKWPYMWYGMGLTRIVLARAGNVAREGPLQPPGVTNEAAAGHAFVRALELEPELSLAAEALALAPIPREGASQMAKRLSMLRRVRHDTMVLSPTAWAMMGVVERIAGSPDSAAAVLGMALQLGADSGFAGYEMARAFFLAGREAEGRDAFAAATEHARSPLGRARFDRTIRLLGNPAEVVAWDSVPSDGRKAWFASFWDRRDVRDGRATGETLVEHFRRTEDAWRRYRVDIPRTGRHKDAIANGLRGSASGVSVVSNDEVYSGMLDVNAAPPDVYRASYDISAPFRTFTLPDDQLDDRGVIFLRHGNPSARATTVDEPELELWRYDLPTGPRFFAFREVQFDGTTGAGVLTPQIATAASKQQLCAIDERLCYVVKGRESIQAMNMRAEGLEAIRIGTTTDAHRRTFTGAINPIVQIYGLDRAEGGSPRLVGAFAIPADKLAHTSPPEAGGRTVYSVRLQLMAVGTAGRRTEIDTTRHFATARPLSEGEYLTGVVELPAPAGAHSASLVISQADGRGAVASLGTVTVPGRGGLVLSDVVLGREDSGVRWNSGATMVPLNPLNAYLVGGSAELYYQVSGQVQGVTFATRLEFFKAGEEDKPPKLAIAFRGEARADREEVVRTVALGELAPGRYRLRVTVTGNNNTATSTAWLAVNRK